MKTETLHRDEIEMRNAVIECQSYMRMGGLNKQVLEDIAHDHGVDAKELEEELEQSQ